MYESPRLRRLNNDLAALERLRDDSTVLTFRATGRPAQQYVIEFHGKSLARHRGKVSVSDRHVVEIKLGASYPRTMPEIRWVTPIYHPNISEIGMVCLGGYGTHWVPSLNLEELVGMLWDMARYHNYDVRSPYNRDAALWVAGQGVFTFPLDPRPLRDLRARLGRVDPAAAPAPTYPNGPSFIARLFADVGRKRGSHARPSTETLTFETPPADAPTVVDTSDEPVLLEPVGPPPAPEAEAEPEAAAPAPETAGPDGLLVIDDAVELEPVGRPVRLRAQDEEILFLD